MRPTRAEPHKEDPPRVSASRRRSRRRLAAAAALLVVVTAGLAVNGLLPDTAATDIAGDALYAAAAYVFVVLLAPCVASVVVGAVAAAWCVGVELLQLTGIPHAAGAAFPPAMLVLGTVFDARDLIVYLVTIAALAALDTALRRRGTRP